MLVNKACRARHISRICRGDRPPPRQRRMRLPVPVILKGGPLLSQALCVASTSTSRSAWRVERLTKRDLDDENRLPATTLPEGQ
jgi:hypothetical protein